MKRRLFVLLTLALTTTSLLAAETTRYLVSLRKAPRQGRLGIVTNSVEMARHRVRTFTNVNAFAADLTAEEVAQLKASGEVESIAPVVERHLLGEDAPLSTNARYGSEQFVPWGVQTIGAPEVWKITKGSPTVNVAVVDTGIDYTHPDLAHAYAGGYNVFDPAKEPLDDHRHGTHVAGTIVAADNSFGVVGVAPNVRVWAVKVLNDDGKGTDETLTAGLDWVISKAKEVGGRWVMNLSLGSKFGSDTEKVAISRAIAANIVIVAAAGNTGMAALNYPAGYPGVIAVGATDSQNVKARWSTFGPGLAVVAPGVSVPSTYRGGYSTSADVALGGTLVNASGITGSPFGELTGRLVDCGLGGPGECPSSVRGRIALIRRGTYPFREKARNAKEAGAAAVVIYNDPGLPDDVENWTLVYRTCDTAGCTMPPEWANYEFPLTLGLRHADAETVKGWAGKTVAVGFRPEAYGPMSGTSMATPHVAGAAALLLSLAPDLNNSQVALVLEKTATDLGTSGWDLETAWGIINLPAAAKYVAPGAFGLPPANPIPPPKRRGTRS